MNSFYELEYVIDSALLNSKVIRRGTIAGGTKVDLVWYTQLIVDQLRRNNAKPLCKTDGYREVVIFMSNISGARSYYSIIVYAKLMSLNSDFLSSPQKATNRNNTNCRVGLVRTIVFDTETHSKISREL